MLTRIIKALASLAAMVAILAGTPLVLLKLGTNPWTSVLWVKDHLWDVDYGNIVLLGALTAVGWIAWLTLVQAFLAAVFDVLRPGTRTLPAITAQRAMFTALLGVFLTTSTASLTTTSSTMPLDRPAVVAMHDATAPIIEVAGPPVVHRGPNIGNALIHTVVRGEHLLDLAERYYGRADAYPLIVSANSGVTQPDGLSLRHGEIRIREGWQLRIVQPTQGTDTPAAVVQADGTAVTTGTITLTANQQTYEMTVRPGDNLFTIAERYLGDGDRWPEIYELNKGRHFDDGRTLRKPRLIHPGWELQLPDDARPPGHTAPPTKPGLPAKPVEPPTASPQPTTPPGTPGAPPTSANPSGAASPSASQAPDRNSSPIGIELPGGGWVDAGLAAALAGLVALVWAHRNRRYRRGHQGRDGVDRADADLRPLPAVIRYLRARLAPTPAETATAEPSDQWLTDLLADSDQPPPSDVTGAAPAGFEAPASDGPDGDRPACADREPDDVEEQEEDLVAAGDAQPVVPAITGRHADLWPTSGLGLTGPGAYAAARGMLVAALACGQPNQLHSRTRVVITAGTLASLLGANAVRVPESTRLEVTAGLEEALAEIEARALYRARLCHEHDAFSVAELREAHPDVDDLPPLLLITDVGTATEQTRIAWALSHHYRLDVHGILLGGWTHGDTVHVEAEGTTTAPPRQHLIERHRHGHGADLGRLTVLDEDQTTAMLTFLAEAHNGKPAPDPQIEPPAATPADDPAPTSPMAAVDEDDADLGGDQSGAPGAEPDRQPVTDREPDTGDERVPQRHGETPVVARHQAAFDAAEQQAPEPAAAGIGEELAGAAAGRVRVVLLGRAHLPDYDRPGKLGGRERAMELLAYLAVHDGEASIDRVLEDLVPDATFSKAKLQLNTTVYALRQALAEAAGTGEYVDRDKRRIALRKDRFDIDLWQLRKDLARAKTAPQVHRTQLLRRAVAAYRGPFADGETKWYWADVHRENVRRDYIDAVLGLAHDLAGQPTDVLAVLEPAIAGNPYTEVLYQEAMRAYAALGDDAGIKRLRRHLTRALEDIDAEPDDDTRALAVSLLADVTRRAGRSGPERGNRR